MAAAVRRIGLSLGADLCWPVCFEELMKRLDLEIDVGAGPTRFEVERVTIEPFNLRQPCQYDVVLDRVTHWYHTSREWIKKSILMDGLYVLNNPWSIQAMEKQTSYCAMMALGMPVPETWMVPPKAYEPQPDLNTTLERYAKLFDLGAVGRDLGYPFFMKPYDGGAWVGVTKIDREEQLREAYDESGTRIMHLQKGVIPFDLFIRCLGIGPQLRFIRYDPEAPLHGRYQLDSGTISAAEKRHLENMTFTINAFFGWDFNSCEVMRKEGVFHPIDFANACPDSQVTSLHYHFPWLVKAKVRWAVFCAATGRRMRRTLDWDEFYEIAATDASFEEKLEAYGDIARARFEADRFAEFCDRHLGHLDEIAWEFFGSDTCHSAVHRKVAALYPEHEIETFTEHFWNLVQQWRSDTAGGKDAAASVPG